MISLLAAISGTMILLVTWLEISGLLACHGLQNHLFWSTTPPQKKNKEGGRLGWTVVRINSHESDLHSRKAANTGGNQPILKWSFLSGFLGKKNSFVVWVFFLGTSNSFPLTGEDFKTLYQGKLRKKTNSPGNIPKSWLTRSIFIRSSLIISHPKSERTIKPFTQWQTDRHEGGCQP